LLHGGQSELFQIAQRIAASHHERWDGSGYPQGLRGDEIPLEARIVSLADVFDSLTHARPYKAAWIVDAAVAEIERQSGLQFAPGVVQEFPRLPHESLL
jgi:putative two-component system response regulator